MRCTHGRAHAIPLVRGLASIDVADEYGLVHYQGERVVTLVGLGLLLLIPLAAAIALGTDHTGLATTLLCMSFIGLPALAFLDARRAGEQSISDPPAMPPSAPDLPDVDESADDDEPDADQGPFMVFRGQAVATESVIVPQLSSALCLAYRLDIRAGRDAQLVARYTSDNEFGVTCADGSLTIITGVVELVGRAYKIVEPADQAAFAMNGTDLLPALFTQGGWACEIAIRPDDPIQVQGWSSDEMRSHPLAGLYRQSGFATVLRGTPGHPVIVSLLDERAE